MRTGWVFDERFLWHDSGTAAGTRGPGGWIAPGRPFEQPGVAARTRDLVAASGLLERLVTLRARRASDEELLRVHDAAWIDTLERTAAAGGGTAGVNVPVGVDSVAIARLAAGGAVAAVDAVLDGTVDNAYALLRPPGHHATPTAGRGFCLLNSVAVAVQAARARGAGRVAVVDWDVHHGNGTQDAFLDDPAVLTVSLHQDRLFPPDSGGVDETGAAGTNINVPLPPGCGEGAYVEAMRTVVVPAVRAFAPELIVVACGFDASALDPLGRMQLRARSFALLARAVLGLASDVCAGRVVCCHEGGYSEYYVPFCVVAVIEELSESRTGVEDPYFPPDRELSYDALQDHQRRAIEAGGAAPPGESSPPARRARVSGRCDRKA
jgi:acetoin utilization deacetylase AcuC-like enzyme